MAWWSRWFGSRRGADERVEAPGGPHTESATKEARKAVFLETVATIVRETFPDLDLQRDPQNFTLTIGDSQTLFLNNLFLETRELSPEERDARLRRLVHGLVADFERSNQRAPWDEARERLVPCLRTVSFAAGTGVDERLFVRRPFLPMLMEMVALDSPATLSYVTSEDATSWNASLDDLFAGARAVLNGVETRLEAYDPEASYPLWFVANDDSYESSRLVLPGFLASLSSRVHGRPIAIVPHTRLLVMGGDGDAECVRRLLDVARREYESSARAISPAVYTVDEAGAVVPLVLPDGHPLAGELALSHRILELAEYTCQKEALEKSAEAREDVAFVASYTLLKLASGSSLNYAAWPPGIPTLLPRTEHIALGGGASSERSVMAPWSAVEALEPPCLVLEPEMNPPRYRTVRELTEAELQKLHAKSP